MANVPTQTPHDVSRGLTLAQVGSSSRSYPRISATWRSVDSGARELFFKEQKIQKKEADVPGKFMIPSRHFWAS
jgi:hypothetical protein